MFLRLKKGERESSIQLFKGILKDVHLVLDVPHQISDRGLVVDHFNALSVGVVAQRERARNCPSKLPA